MCERDLQRVYGEFVKRTEKRSRFVEKRFSWPAPRAPLVEHNHSEILEAYQSVFSEQCRAHLEALYRDLIDALRGQPLVDCRDEFIALEFLQEATSTALWKYRFDVAEPLGTFARQNDRLDTDEVQVRLHREAQ